MAENAKPLKRIIKVDSSGEHLSQILREMSSSDLVLQADAPMADTLLVMKAGPVPVEACLRALGAFFSVDAKHKAVWNQVASQPKTLRLTRDLRTRQFNVELEQRRREGLAEACERLASEYARGGGENEGARRRADSFGKGVMTFCSLPKPDRVAIYSGQVRSYTLGALAGGGDPRELARALFGTWGPRSRTTRTPSGEFVKTSFPGGPSGLGTVTFFTAGRGASRQICFQLSGDPTRNGSAMVGSVSVSTLFPELAEAVRHESWNPEATRPPDLERLGALVQPFKGADSEQATVLTSTIAARLAQTSSLMFISDHYGRELPVQPFSRKEPLRTVIQRFTMLGRIRGVDDGFLHRVTDDGLHLFRSASWIEDQRATIPHRWIEGWRKSCTRNGGFLRLIDLAQMSALSMAHQETLKEWFVEAWGIPESCDILRAYLRSKPSARTVDALWDTPLAEIALSPATIRRFHAPGDGSNPTWVLALRQQSITPAMLRIHTVTPRNPSGTPPERFIRVVFMDERGRVLLQRTIALHRY